MRLATRATATVAALVMAVTLAGCGSDDTDIGDGAGDVARVEPATPAASPPQSSQVAGIVEPAAAGTALVQSGSTVLILGDDGAVDLRVQPGALDGPAARRLALSKVTALTADGETFVAASPGRLSRITRTGEVTEIGPIQGDVRSLAVANDGRILAGTADGRLLVVTTDGKLQKNLHKFVQVSQILVAPQGSDVAGQVIVVDREQSSVTPIDIDTGEVKAALRAGNGATDGVMDGFGRFVVANTRDGEVLGFFGAPIIMRFRFPVAPSPYAVAYDSAQNLLWVSTTGDNRVTAYSLATGEPREQVRLTTVGQVSAMTVDPVSGSLYLLSGRGDGLQAVFRRDVDAAR